MIHDLELMRGNSSCVESSRFRSSICNGSSLALQLQLPLDLPIPHKATPCSILQLLQRADRLIVRRIHVPWLCGRSTWGRRSRAGGESGRSKPLRPAHHHLLLGWCAVLFSRRPDLCPVGAVDANTPRLSAFENDIVIMAACPSSNHLRRRSS